MNGDMAHIDVPRSEKFDDVYFSVVDGLSETRHVFLNGNGLPEAWQGRGGVTICETGFGTGLNFLATLKLWLDSPVAERPKKLHFISFEKYPLTREYIAKHLAVWNDLSDILGVFLSKYPIDLNVSKVDLDICDGVVLTLCFGDVNVLMPTIHESVDFWFLDGFKPSSNPDMWSDNVFQNMARLSQIDARIATFTAAGFVRRGLVAAGFEIQKVRGFGRKREMVIGRYVGGDDAR